MWFTFFKGATEFAFQSEKCRAKSEKRRRWTEVFMRGLMKFINAFIARRGIVGESAGKVPAKKSEEAGAL